MINLPYCKYIGQFLLLVASTVVCLVLMCFSRFFSRTRDQKLTKFAMHTCRGKRLVKVMIFTLKWSYLWSEKYKIYVSFSMYFLSPIEQINKTYGKDEQKVYIMQSCYTS